MLRFVPRPPTRHYQDRQRLLTGCNDKKLRVFDLNSYNSGTAYLAFIAIIDRGTAQRRMNENQRRVFGRLSLGLVHTHTHTPSPSTTDPLVTTAHTANIKRAVFDSEGGLIYSGGDDKTLKYVAACGGRRNWAAIVS
jgi:WD40 repeat protein